MYPLNHPLLSFCNRGIGPVLVLAFVCMYITVVIRSSLVVSAYCTHWSLEQGCLVMYLALWYYYLLFLLICFFQNSPFLMFWFARVSTCIPHALVSFCI